MRPILNDDVPLYHFNNNHCHNKYKYYIHYSHKINPKTNQQNLICDSTRGQAAQQGHCQNVADRIQRKR